MVEIRNAPVPYVKNVVQEFLQVSRSTSIGTTSPHCYKAQNFVKSIGFDVAFDTQLDNGQCVVHRLETSTTIKTH